VATKSTHFYPRATAPPSIRLVTCEAGLKGRAVRLHEKN
jgi:hypothetical protein